MCRNALPLIRVRAESYPLGWLKLCAIDLVRKRTFAAIAFSVVVVVVVVIVAVVIIVVVVVVVVGVVVVVVVVIVQ